MKILVDEHIPLMTARELRSRGHDVLDFRGTTNEGMQDAALWNLAQQERRLVITADKGFAKYRSESHSGLLIIRLQQPNRHKIHYRIMQALSRFDEDEWPNLLVIMRDIAQSAWRIR